MNHCRPNIQIYEGVPVLLPPEFTAQDLANFDLQERHKAKLLGDTLWGIDRIERVFAIHRSKVRPE